MGRIDLGSQATYHPKLAKALGGVTQGILLRQLFQISNESSDPDGWVCKTPEELYAELHERAGLSADEHRTARRALIRLGVLEERRQRLLDQRYFRVNLDALDEVWGRFSSQIDALTTEEKSK